MSPPVLLDTGPLVAFLNRRDHHHAWAREVLSGLTPPLFTCEAVISEACFLVRNLPGGPQAVLSLLREDLVRIAFSLSSELERTARLLKKYADVPMSLADGCLVRMAELQAGARVLTLDSNFRRYRRNGREAIPVLTP